MATTATVEAATITRPLYPFQPVGETLSGFWGGTAASWSGLSHLRGTCLPAPPFMEWLDSRGDTRGAAQMHAAHEQSADTREHPPQSLEVRANRVESKRLTVAPPGAGGGDRHLLRDVARDSGRTIRAAFARVASCVLEPSRVGATVPRRGSRLGTRALGMLRLASTRAVFASPLPHPREGG
jgi:hypothetical protein